MKYSKNDTITLKLTEILHRERATLEKLYREYKILPRGHLSIRVKKGYTTFYYVDGKVESSIHKSDKIIYTLARKAIIEKEINRRKAECKTLEKAIRETTAYNNKYTYNKTYHRILELPEPDNYLLSKADLNWKNSFDNNSYRTQDLAHKTSSGLLVRSKSERIIANLLDEYGIIYVYEPKFYISGKYYYPDFVILKCDGTIVIWEHFGLMDNDDYFKKAIDKIERYRCAGFIQSKNLICTYESDIEDEKLLHDIILRFII